MVGSFLNVVIYRVPRHQSIVSPGSRCPSCGTHIRPLDNLPLISWLVLKGRCRACDSRISGRYPAIELLSGALFAALAALLGAHWKLSVALVFFAALIGLAAIDVELLVLPRSIIYVALTAEVILETTHAAGTRNWHDLIVGALCAVSWFALFYLINFFAPKALGFGDVRLSLLLGLVLGWLNAWFPILALFSGSLIGSIVGIFLIASGRMTRRQPIPFGVFLAIGAGLVVLVGPHLPLNLAHG